VITLGLVETWFDTDTGWHANLSPPFDEDCRRRFRFRVLDFDEIRGSLGEIHSLLSRFDPHEVQIVVTLSPVPLGATFTGQD